jgi:hypothetical protein
MILFKKPTVGLYSEEIQSKAIFAYSTYLRFILILSSYLPLRLQRDLLP